MKAVRVVFSLIGRPSLWLANPLLGFRGQDLETQPRPGVCLTLESQDYISAFFADDVLLSASMVNDLQLHWKSLQLSVKEL